MPSKPKEETKDKEGGGRQAPGAGPRNQIPQVPPIGHKGANAIIAGNTAESFDAAVEHGVDMIELDVLREQEGRLIVAHDFDETLYAGGRWTITEALDLFLEPPLDDVRDRL